MTSKTTWKKMESDVGARWFDSKRNPLSGRNNIADDGSRRLGDIVYPHAVIECKVRKSIASIGRALETKELAESNGKPWVHIERQKGDAQTFAVVLPLALMDVAMKAVRAHIEGRDMRGNTE